MKHRVFRLFVDFEKEEKWLNEMAAKGYHFIDYSFPGAYLFEQGTPGKYLYRLELLKNMPSHPESQAYIEFMDSTGVELVSTYIRWVYFRKKAEDGPFDLYTDCSSIIKHYLRIIWLIGFFGILNLACGILNLSLGILVHQYMASINTFVSILNLVVAFICLRSVTRYYSKIKELKKESQIHE